MKKRLIIKIVALVLFSLLIISYPAKMCVDSIIRYKMYNDLCYNEHLFLDLPSSSFSVFYGKSAIQNAENYINEVQNVVGVESTHVFDTNPDLITRIFIGTDNLVYKTISEQSVSDRGESTFNYRRLEVENFEGYSVENSSFWNPVGPNIGSYELPEIFQMYDYLKCERGRYPDFTKKYKSGDTVEIMVTDGMGLDVGDKCFIALDALDENNELVVVKAEVVGIASKGVFLPYYKGYFSGDSTNVENAYKRVLYSEMIYYTNLGGLYKYNSHFTPDEVTPDTTTVTMVSFDDENTSVDKFEMLLDEFDGSTLVSKKGLFLYSVNISGLRDFIDYSDLGFAESLSIAQRELYLSVSLIVFMLFFVVVIILKIISMLKEYANTVKGEE